MRDLTPVIIGVGEASERIDAADYTALSPADLAGRAARAALDDALSTDHLAPAIDVIAAIRQFEVSGPGAVRRSARRTTSPARSPGGSAPIRPAPSWSRSAARARSTWSTSSPRTIAAGEMGMALLVGSEAISTVRHLSAKGETRDWAESRARPARGSRLRRSAADPRPAASRRAHADQLYALFENARGRGWASTRRAYRLDMGRLFAPFTKVAAGNPHAMSREVYTRRGTGHGHRAQPADLRSLPAPDGGARPGQSGRGGAA